MVFLLREYARTIYFTIITIGACILVTLPAQAQLLPAREEEAKYDEGKLEIICQSIKFYLSANARENASNAIDCSSLEAIEQTIPEDYRATNRFFNLFKKKRYRSYGRGKLGRRLEKLIKDINTELQKTRQDAAWTNKLAKLIERLIKVKDLVIQGKSVNSIHETSDTSQQANVPTSTTQQKPKEKTPKQTDDRPMSIFLSIVSLIAVIALGVMAYRFFQKLNEIQEQIADLDEAFKEKYSRLDNRIDTMTPVRDFRSVFPQIQQLNDDIHALGQEIQLLRTRNQFKISPEELYAKRTEHLETHSYSPEIRIYYAKFHPEQNGFMHQEFHTEPSKEYIYKIEISTQNPLEASYQVVSRNEYHHLALNYEGSMLAPVAEYLNRPVNAYRIITKKPGKLKREENTWVITEKAQLAFE
ncbi:hypothetical protein [uncultured Microscilla sp.]|uniref:hypothetical protein n=1 Tax=uncultured Microscilla sp. TaxID=432653 RepID=UPI0026029012|nr:hypothetical protein [uncultured Microscilla sp.]